MELRAILREWKQSLSPFLTVIAFVVVGIAIAWLLPNRSAAVSLGILAGAMAAYLILTRTRQTTKIAVLWGAIGIAADAAYAKLNDQMSVTVANALMKLVDGFVKLADVMIKSSGIAAVDARTKVAAVTPDFVWALIISLILFMWIGFLMKQDT